MALNMDVKKFIEYLNQEDINYDVDGFNSNNSFSDNGIDSLDIFTVLLKIEDDLGIKVPDSDLDNINTVDELITYINDKL